MTPRRPQTGCRWRISKFQSSDNILGVQWGKLLVNLNNALNALSNLPLRRPAVTAPMANAAGRPDGRSPGGIDGGGIAPVSTTPLPASWTPRTSSGCRIGLSGSCGQHDEDRSWRLLLDVEDLQRGRRTEIVTCRRAIIAIAQRQRLTAPVSSRVGRADQSRGSSRAGPARVEGRTDPGGRDLGAGLTSEPEDAIAAMQIALKSAWVRLFVM